MAADPNGRPEDYTTTAGGIIAVALAAFAAVKVYFRGKLYRDERISKMDSKLDGINAHLEYQDKRLDLIEERFRIEDLFRSHRNPHE